MKKVPSSAVRFADATAIATTVVLGLLTLVVYAGVKDHEFVEFDDRVYVIENPNLDGSIDLVDLRNAFLEPHASNWAPLTSISLATSDAIHGPDPGAYALTNVFLHIGAGVFLFAALLRLTGRFGSSAFVTAVFLLHPLHVESVAWVAERKNVLAAFFWMAALCAYARQCPPPGERASEDESFGLSGWVVLWSGLSMLSKGTSVAIPVALLLVDFWPLGRFTNLQRVWRALWAKWPLVVGAAGVSVATLMSQTKAMSSAEVSPISMRLLNTGFAYTQYMADLIWPTALAVYYPFPDDATLLAPSAFAAIGFIALLSVGAALLWRRVPLVTMGWFWFLITLVPMIGIVRVGGQSHADRYMYIPHIGLTLILAFGVDAWLSRGKKARADGVKTLGPMRLVAASAVMVVCILSVATYRQVGVWQDTVTLFAHAAKVDEENYFAHGAVGKAYWIAGDRKSSEKHLLEALRLRPQAASARVVLATIYLHTGRLEEARAHLDRAFRDGGDPATIWAARGVMAGNRGDEKGAAEAYERALEAQPETRDWEMLNNLAWIRAASANPALRSPSQALELSQLALTIRPDDPFVRGTRAAALASAGRMPEAVAAQERAVEAARARGMTALLGDFEARLEQYRAGRSFGLQ